jgi:hypothetical protein
MIPIYSHYGNIPDLNNTNKNTNKPQSAKQPKSITKNKINNDDLPACTFKAILNHIINNKMYK